jgi:hypothetical protein
MHCACSSFGCPGLAAKGRRNRLTTTFEFPRHQSRVFLLVVVLLLCLDQSAKAEQSSANDLAGIGTTTPDAPLFAYPGGVRIGSTGTPCTKDLAGTLRFADDKLWLCNSYGWRPLVTTVPAQ